MKTLLITDRHSDSSKLSMMKIRKCIKLESSATLTITETMPWIRIELRYDETLHDSWSLISQLREHGFVAAEI